MNENQYEVPTILLLGDVSKVTLHKTDGEDDEPWNVTLVWDNIPPVRREAQREEIL